MQRKKCLNDDGIEERERLFYVHFINMKHLLGNDALEACGEKSIQFP